MRKLKPKKYTAMIIQVVMVISGLAVFNSGISSTLNENIETTEGQQFFKDHVKNILDTRCVACHSCYDSPCGLNLASIDGIARGMATSGAYTLRVTSADQTRLFIDADSTHEWRKKKFFSIFGDDLIELNRSSTDLDETSISPFKDSLNQYSEDKSILKAVLALKKENPVINQEYTNEAGDVCPVGFNSDIKKLSKIDKQAKPIEPYLNDNIFAGMPYGFPALKYRKDLFQMEEYGDILYTWLDKYKGTLPIAETQMKLPDEAIKWEKLLNFDKNDSYSASFKRTLTAKYIYEHLFLAHIYFKENTKYFYRLVRSVTQSPLPIREISTRRPNDSPFEVLPSSAEKKFYYRFRKITSTAVNKTHIVLKLDLNERKKIQNNFLLTSWIKDNANQFLGYGQYPISEIFSSKKSANPYYGFAPIPPKTRYEFMLSHAEYFVRTFIRGPACSGQTALNVINDHSWVNFLDPDIDPSVQDEKFLFDQKDNLDFPTTKGKIGTFINAMIPNRYIKRANAFNQERIVLLSNIRKNGLLITDFWDGNDNSLLTVYRHKNSATVLKGLRGGIPKTAWTLDYPTFETIYYNLVVNFDLYSSTLRQATTRKYMELSRLYSEDLFLNIFTEENRKSMRKYWMRDDSGETKAKSKHKMLPFRHVNNIHLNNENDISDITYELSKKENKLFIVETFKKIITEMQKNNKNWIQFDAINCTHKKCFTKTPMLNDFESQARIFREKIHGKKSLQGYPELVFIRVTNKNNIGIAWYTMIKNTGHFNVASMFNENARLDPDLNSVEFHKGFVGSYPNLFLSLQEGEEALFFKSLENNNLKNGAIAWSKNPFVIGRFHKNFWNIYDEVNSAYKGSAPWGVGFKAGLFDLSRYMNVFNKNPRTIQAGF